MCFASALLPPNHPQAVRLLVNGRARVLGKLGDRNQAERAIGQALELSDRHHVAPGLTSCISFSPYGRARTLSNAMTAPVDLQGTGHVLRVGLAHTRCSLDQPRHP